MYKPGQLITKQLHGANRVFRIAKRKPWDSTCTKCIIPRIVFGLRMFKNPICKWCIYTLDDDLYLKNP